MRFGSEHLYLMAWVILGPEGLGERDSTLIPCYADVLRPRMEQVGSVLIARRAHDSRYELSSLLTKRSRKLRGIALLIVLLESHLYQGLQPKHV